MIDYDSQVLHTNLWEEIEDQPWKPLEESRGKWRDHDYIANTTDTTYHTGYTLREYTSANQFLTNIRPESIKKASFPLEVSISFINEKTLDKVEFTIFYKTANEAELEMSTATAILTNKLKTSSRWEYDSTLSDEGKEEHKWKRVDIRTPESDPKKQNSVHWEEKRIKTKLSTLRCYNLCKEAIKRLQIKRFREIKRDEDLKDLVNKHEVFKNCIIDKKSLNEVFFHSTKKLYENEELIASDLDFEVPGTAKEFTNYRTLLNFINPKNLIENEKNYTSLFPLDVYIQFASPENGRVAGIWISYPTKPEGRSTTARITLCSAIPYVFQRQKPRDIVIRTIRDKNDVMSVIKSDDLYLDWNYRRSHIDTTIIKAYGIVNGMIHKLMGEGFYVMPEEMNIIEFITKKPELTTRSVVNKPQVKKGRPAGTTKKLW